MSPGKVPADAENNACLLGKKHTLSLKLISFVMIELKLLSLLPLFQLTKSLLLHNKLLNNLEESPYLNQM